MNLMKVSHIGNCSTSTNVQIHIYSSQKLVEEAPVSIVLSPGLNARRSTSQPLHRSTSVHNHHTLDPEGYARAIDGHTLKVSREDIADILQLANGAENLFMQQHNMPKHQQLVTNEFYDIAGGLDDRFKPKHRQHTRPSIKIGDQTSIDRRPEFGKGAYDRDGIWRFQWEEKDEYGV
ncbi:hypothetical protein F2Q69_00043098 [Brassica cretica]|uniref:Uncharacterized protein n=1 Tax=Brassica cretica TaxID=69181 RepID=A0A8S9NHF5_BRACR|nr:hypothetical protein F2Q69_00043098 [Brassica cretica]